MFRLLVLSVVLACAYGAALPKNVPLVPMLDGRIVGGTNTPITAVPWIVSMVFGGSHRCGGSVLTTTRILTAAHCTVGVTATQLSVRAGTAAFSGGTVIGVTSVVNHGSYNAQTLNNDVSVMYLVSALPLSGSIAVVNLSPANTVYADGTSSLVAGWGTTSEGGSLPTTLQSVTLPIVSNARCATMNSGITDQMMCAGYTAGGSDACQGDSGGPLTVNSIQAGIVSWGVGCARPNLPGVYARVAALRPFIDQHTN